MVQPAQETVRRYSTNDIDPAEPILDGGCRGPVLLVRRPIDWLLTPVKIAAGHVRVAGTTDQLREYRTSEPSTIAIFNLSKSRSVGNAI